MKTAVILAGGRGTRLKPLTVTIPKPLLPLDDVPIMEVVLSQLGRAKFERVIITTGYLGHLIEATIGDGSRWGLEVEYCSEDSPLGTAGPLAFIDNLDSPFIVLNGDLLTDLDFNRLYQSHLESRCLATIAVHQRVVEIDYGVIEFDSSNHLAEYTEKPSIPYYVSMGINVLSPQALDYIPRGDRFDIPELMTKLKSHGHQVNCHLSDCYWKDIGRLDDFNEATEDFIGDRNRFFS